MKKIIFFALCFFFYSKLDAQIKLIARSTYGYNGTAYYVLDTNKYFDSPTNMTTIDQNNTEGYVNNTFDSTHYFYYNSTTTNLDLNYRAITVHDASYTKQLSSTYHYYNNNVYESFTQNNNFHTGNLLDSALNTQTTVSTSNTVFYGKDYFHYNVGNYNDTVWYVSFQPNGAFSKVRKNYFTYTANNLIDETVQLESTDSLNYTFKTKSKNYYNLANNIDSTISYSWQTGQWYKLGKKEYTYNASQMKIRDELFYFNNTTSTYTPSNRIQYLRVNGTLPDSIYHQAWNQTTLKYDTLNKYGFIHYNGLLLHAHSYTFNTTSQQWEKTPMVSVINYYYNMLPNGVESVEQNENEVLLYPNPTNNFIYLQNAQHGLHYQINSIDGKNLMSGELGATKAIPVQFLTKGIYILTLNQEGKISRKKFMKQ